MCSLNSSISNLLRRVLGLTNTCADVLLSCPGLATLQLSPACLHLAGVNGSFPCVFFIFQVHIDCVLLYFFKYCMTARFGACVCMFLVLMASLCTLTILKYATRSCASV